MHESFALVVLLLNDPIPLLRAIVWELHQGVRASSALVQAVVCKSVVALADRSGAFLVARAVSIAILFSAQVHTHGA